MEARSRNHCCSGEAITVTGSGCVSVALVIPHATRMCRVIFLSAICLDLPYFSTISHKWNYFRKILPEPFPSSKKN